MKPIEEMEHFELAEDLVKILKNKTQNQNDLFFRILVTYYFTKIASMMRCNITTHDRGDIPVNMYAINLGESGFGKGFSTNIIEEQVIGKFRKRFLDETFPHILKENIEKLATKRCAINDTEYEEELEKVQKEANNLGELAFSFDSGTPAAIKQMRHLLLISKVGSMNFEMDEISSNLTGNMEALTVFLELFDVGKVKQKLVKNTKESIRSKEIDGRTPTNLMLYGTPVKLLNGSVVEDSFRTMLDIGYARRCVFGYTQKKEAYKKLTAQEIYDKGVDNKISTFLIALNNRLSKLADLINYKVNLQMTKDVSILVIEYMMLCTEKANKMPDHQSMQKAEMLHRYFKALKIAGTYAFIEQNAEITEDNLYSAIALVEESGLAFYAILNQDKNYVRLAKYIAAIDHPVTHVDLIEELPCYKGSESQKREMLLLAIAWGYKNNVIIRRTITDGIEFISGDSLKETNLDEIIISYSKDITTGYLNQIIKFSDLTKLTNTPNYHFAAFHFEDGYRKDCNALPSFNLCILDVDDGTAIKLVQLLLKNYTYLIYTTKRHTQDVNRFRVILPLSHELRLNADDYKQFMENVYAWLPFSVDTQTNQRSRKWLSNNGQQYHNKGELLDSLRFIPQTKKSEEQSQIITDQKSLSNMERWFVSNISDGNRSNQLIKYALLLVDAGMDLTSIQNQVIALNNKLPNKLSETEILSTIMQTTTKAIYKRDSKP